jgi:hypothetical protein
MKLCIESHSCFTTFYIFRNAIKLSTDNYLISKKNQQLLSDELDLFFFLESL